MLEALNSLCPGRVDPNFSLEVLESVNKPNELQFFANGARQDPIDTVKNLLYGAHLHGDYSRWYELRGSMALSNQIQTWIWVGRLEATIHRIRDFVQKLIDAGDLALGDPPPPLGT